MIGTVRVQVSINPMNGRGQLSAVRSIGSLSSSEDGSGTDGGEVVLRNAAKYKHKAGPENENVEFIIRCPKSDRSSEKKAYL